jgi:curved DNA-binding protein CbpA
VFAHRVVHWSVVADRVACLYVDTFDLLPSLAQGDLRATSAAELVAAVLRSKASGTLIIESERTGEIRAFFRAGDMCGTASFNGSHTLAHVMLANDWADALQIESTQLAAAKAGKRHGEMLVEQGLLTREQLCSALVVQHRHNLALLLALGEGAYEWRGWEPPPAWAVEVTVDPVACIVDALQSEAMVARRKRVLTWLDGHAVKLSVDWPDLQARAALSEGDRRAASLLASPRHVRQFVSACGLPTERAEALLVTLLLTGGAEPDKSAVKTAPADEDEPIDLIPMDPPAKPTAHTPASLRKAAVDDSPLELDRGDDAEARAREVRMRMRTQGLRNLGIAPTPQPTPARHTPANAVRHTPKHNAAAPGDLDSETLAFADEVRRRVAALNGQNAYALLGVASNATQEQIKHAYLHAAKRYHPDRAAATPGLGGLLPELQALFSALKEAHDQIATPAARTQYDQQLRHGATGKVRKEEATLELKMGEVLLKKRDFAGALPKLRRAVDLDANADALAALAWAIVSDPKATADGKEEAMSLINRALRAPGATARTYYVAGVLWRNKDPASAADAFRKALELDPKHADASLELRVLESRQGKSPAKGGGVLSNLLFGRRKS